VKALTGWIGRQIILFLLLAVAIAIFQSGALTLRCANGCGPADVDIRSDADDIARNFDALVDQGRGRLDRNLASFASLTEDRRRSELEAREVRQDEIDELLSEKPGILDQYLPARVVERQRLQIERAIIEQEITVLKAHLDLDSLKRGTRIEAPTEQAVREAKIACDAARDAVQDFNRLSIQERWARNRIGRNDADVLTANARRLCAQASNGQKRRETALAMAEARDRQIAEAQSVLAEQERTAHGALEKLRTPETRDMVADIATKAALALMAIIAMPFLIRTFLYFALAPLAAMRPSIRMPTIAGSGAAIPLPEASRVSLSVRLGEGEELLVRQGYLQTSSTKGSKSTRWLLDYRHPLSSLAAGLSFLTRIRGTDEATTVSATRDGFAELAAIDLPAGAACMLHPRALVGVVQPVGQPIAIRSHWRLFSVNAWLTMQLRFFSFHGPGRLIVKGGRGIRVERAERGRIFAQDQLVGFSADLAYSVTRAETFAPFLFGLEPLLKDQVEEGSGILVIEEAPLSMSAGKAGKGLEGMVDAGLKAFGL
jgi:hypothetical protein